MARIRRVPGSRSVRSPRRSRSTAIAMGLGVAVLLVFALIFSVSYGTRGIAAHADSLHNADEALRAATVARSQGGLAAHLSLLEAEFGFDASEGVEVTTREARASLGDLDASLGGLEGRGLLDDPLRTAAEQFGAAVAGIVDAVDSGDLVTARALANESLDASFRTLIGYLVAVRDTEAAAVAAANDTMGRLGDLARFLVAFIVPTAVILSYRELARRQQRQRELEVRLQAEQSIGKARDEFVANASHELRTPLTSIFGLAHVLEEDSSVQQSETAPEMIGMIISEAHDLSRMVDDLLTTARLDAGALHYQFEHLGILDEIHEVVEPMRRAGMSVAVDAQPTVVRSDRLRLRQVIRNLLSNAGKYGGSRIRIVGRVVSGWYELRVEDDGEGIPKDLEERLFQRFLHQGDAPLVVGSVGLGLSIVRALAEGMGGAVWYERTSDGWTSFVVRVPLAPAGAQAPAYREPGAAAPAVAAPVNGGPAREADPVPAPGGGRDGGAHLFPDGYDEPLPAPPPFDPPVPARADSLREMADQFLRDL